MYVDEIKLIDKTNEIKNDILTLEEGGRSRNVFYESTKDYFEEGIKKGKKIGYSDIEIRKKP